MTPGALVPLMLVGAVALALPRGLLSARWAQVAVVLACGAVVGRYFSWRLTQTVWPAEGLNAQNAFIWGLFLVEVLVWSDTMIVFLTILRRTDRSPEADRHETRLRVLPGDELPAVDVLITTYNEPLEVLEKTITGALALDWPGDRLNVYVLDDGKRDWLRKFCAEAGAGYLTRPDNAHAKAGNINAAIPRISGEFFMVLDADFVPHQNFLFRAMGFFEDPKVGIVQIPHNFFNPDPVQAGLHMHRHMPDDQRLFFDAIMPGRDGWGCAFCCGSNSITRRSALMEIGGGLPTGSVTEDIYLTLVMLRRGYVTRYLNEHLATGLAAESLPAYFVQRARWARGNLQLLFLRDGPLGPGLTWLQRIFFLPTHWITAPIGHVAAMAVPAIYLWTGLKPLVNANTETILYYQLPAVAATISALRLLAPRQFIPLAASVQSVLQSFRLLPVVIGTLLRPKGHGFKVTPKGRDATSTAGLDKLTIGLCFGLIMATGAGLLLNANFNTALIDPGTLPPIVVFWAIVNMVIMTVVITIAVKPPRLHEEDGIPVSEGSRLHGPDKVRPAEIRELSLSTARVVIPASHAEASCEDHDWFCLDIKHVGRVPATVRHFIRHEVGDLELHLHFHLPRSPIRSALIRRLFTTGLHHWPHDHHPFRVAAKVLLRVFQKERRRMPKAIANLVPPAWTDDHVALQHSDQPHAR